MSIGLSSSPRSGGARVWRCQEGGVPAEGAVFCANFLANFPANLPANVPTNFPAKFSSQIFLAKVSGQVFRPNLPSKCPGQIFQPNFLAKFSGQTFQPIFQFSPAKKRAQNISRRSADSSLRHVRQPACQQASLLAPRLACLLSS